VREGAFITSDGSKFQSLAIRGKKRTLCNQLMCWELEMPTHVSVGRFVVLASSSRDVKSHLTCCIL